MTVTSWKTATDLTVTPLELLVVHQITRKTIRIPWQCLKRIDLTSPWWSGRARKWYKIDYGAKTPLLIGPHLAAQDQFLSSLKTHLEPTAREAI
jgi:hypothetical protein